MDWLSAVSSSLLLITLGFVSFEWIRRRGSQRRDVVAAMLPVVFFITTGPWVGILPEWWAWALFGAFFLGPLMFLRLVRHLHPVPGIVYGLAITIQGSVIAATMSGFLEQRWATAIYLGAVLAPYVMAATLLGQGSIARRGVGRRRLQWAAAAAMLSALVWIARVTSDGAAPASTEGLMVELAFAVAYVWAFATPRFVREGWRALEFQRFVAGLHAESDADIDERLERMRSAAGSVVEADAAFLLTRSEDGGLYVSQDAPFPESDERAWELLEAAQDEPVIVDGWTIIGLKAPDQPHRALVIRLSEHRLFPGEDEEMMKAVAKEIRSRFTELVFREMERRARESAEELATFRSEYLRAVAHEIANPLTPVKMQLAILRRKYGEESAVPFQRIQKSLDRVEALIRDVSTISRLGSAGIQLETEPLDLSQIVQDAVDAYADVAKDGGCRIQADISPGLELLADGLRVRQIIDNLCSNAIKYSPDGGTVAVTARVRAGLAEIIVADQGLGMSREQMDRLFSSYGRVHTDVAPEIAGTGMGLYIARQLARLHGGDLEVFSDGPGQGTRFKLSIPTAGPPAVTVVPDQPPIPGVRVRS